MEDTVANRPTILLDLRSELKPDKLPFIGMAAEWTRKVYDFLGGGISSEITVDAGWAQATIHWRGQHFVILMTSSRGDEWVDLIDCTKPRAERFTYIKTSLGAVFKTILRDTAGQNTREWGHKLQIIEEAEL